MQFKICYCGSLELPEANIVILPEIKQFLRLNCKEQFPPSFPLDS